MSFVEIVLVVGLLCICLTFIALLDIARRDFGSIEKKAVWAFIAAVPFIGFIVYFLIGMKKGKTSSEEK